MVLNAQGLDLGSTLVTIKGNQNCTTTAGETVKRCFNIAPTNTSSRNATITFYFASSELSGNTCDALKAYRWNGSNWVELTLDDTYGGDGRYCEGTPPSVKVKNVSDFSPFVLKSGDPPGGNPTAVTLACFTARSAGAGNGFVLPLALVVLGVVGGMLLWARRRA